MPECLIYKYNAIDDIVAYREPYTAHRFHIQRSTVGEQMSDYALLRNRKVASILVTVKCTRHCRGFCDPAQYR